MTSRIVTIFMTILLSIGVALAQDVAAENLACDSEPVIHTTPSGVDYVRTPDACFEDVEFPGIDYEPQYVEIDGLRVHYAEAGPEDGQPILMLHGEPSWSYLYRKMLPVFADAGYRAIAMDFIGAGRSDKPVNLDYYSYLGQADEIMTFIEALDLKNVTLVVQDWGAYVGLRPVGLQPENFARVVLMNGQLPVIPEGRLPYEPIENPDEIDTTLEPFYADWPDQQELMRDEAGNSLLELSFDEIFIDWMAYTLKNPNFRASETLEGITWFPLSDEVKAAYDAPYPSREYMALARYWPSMMLEVEGLNQDAWQGLTRFEKPFLTIYAPNDAGILGEAETYQRYIDNVPGAVGQPHSTVTEASHYLQEDQGGEIARRIVDFIDANPLP